MLLFAGKPYFVSPAAAHFRTSIHCADIEGLQYQQEGGVTVKPQHRFLYIWIVNEAK